MKIKTIFFLLLSLLILSPSRVSAQTLDPDLDLVIFPPTAYLTVKPGTSITHRILLKYDGKVAIEVMPELVDFATDGLTGTPILQKPSQLSYIQLQNPGQELGIPFKLIPGSQIELVLAIDPPLHAKQDEFPLSLVLTAIPDTTVVFDGGSTQASGAVASNVILSIQNDYDNLGELLIDQIKLPKIIDSFASIKFTTLVKNTGRNAVAAGGQIKLRHGWSKKELKQWFVYPDVILADSTRELRTLLQDPSDLSPEDEVVFEKPNYKPPFLIGPYEVTVELSSANQDNEIAHERTQKVLALPFSVIGLLIFGVILYAIYQKFEQSQSKNTS